MEQPVLSIILPTYNEADNIEKCIARVTAVMGATPHEIIVADDNSPDLTWQKAQELAAKFTQVKVIRRMENRGLYPSAMDGFAAASGQYLALMDADLQHDETILPRLLAAAQAGAQVAIGSRYTAGGGVANWNRARLLLSRTANRAAGLLLKRSASDMMSGFFVIERQTFMAAKKTLRPKGFKVLMDILQNLPDGARVADVGYVFRPRAVGESKLSLKVAWQDAMGLYGLSLGRYLPFPVFIILAASALIMLALAIAR